MIFGRKRGATPQEADDIESVPHPDDGDGDRLADSSGSPEAREEADAVDSPDEPVDLREDGPFDIDEVDLDADDVTRLDLGALVVTPIEGMAMELQVDQKTQAVRAAVVSYEGAAIEISLFASPANGGLAAQTLDELVDATRASGGKARVTDGPFGREVHRDVAVTVQGGRKGRHRSRIWFVDGPRWMLRGVLMGSALDESGPGPALVEDFFRNLVVNRGTDPRAPGDVIPLTMPSNVAGQEGG